ncbi:VCBS repeat-containing protein [bacterium]|nr:VCBS repeat-containing protein [bacterium]
MRKLFFLLVFIYIFSACGDTEISNSVNWSVNDISPNEITPRGGVFTIKGSGFSESIEVYLKNTHLEKNIISNTEMELIIPSIKTGNYQLIFEEGDNRFVVYENLQIKPLEVKYQKIENHYFPQKLNSAKEIIFIDGFIVYYLSETKTFNIAKKTESGFYSDVEYDLSQLCVENETQIINCGLNRRGELNQICKNGFWTNSGICVDSDICKDGKTKNIICENAGMQQQSCIEGVWENQGECIPSEYCENETEKTVFCGINNRGEQKQLCVDNSWVNSENCIDDDVCLDYSERVISCGSNNDGKQNQICNNGVWENSENCQQLDEKKDILIIPSYNGTISKIVSLDFNSDQKRDYFICSKESNNSMFWENLGNKSYKELKIDTMDFECVNAIYKNNSLLILGKNSSSQYFFREYIFENGKWITTSEFENGYLSTTFNNPDSIELTSTIEAYSSVFNESPSKIEIVLKKDAHIRQILMEITDIDDEMFTYDLSLASSGENRITIYPLVDFILTENGDGIWGEGLKSIKFKVTTYNTFFEESIFSIDYIKIIGVNEQEFFVNMGDNYKDIILNNKPTEFTLSNMIKDGESLIIATFGKKIEYFDKESMEWIDILEFSENIKAFSVFDADGDEDVDIFIVSYEGQDSLFINDGNGYFFDISNEYIPFDYSAGTSLVCEDLNGDQLIDIVVGNNGYANRVYLNEGGFWFSDKTINLSTEKGYTNRVISDDIDLDGDIDLIFFEDNGVIIYQFL